jgi:hypothetical protein
VGTPLSFLGTLSIFMAQSLRSMTGALEKFDTSMGEEVRDRANGWLKQLRSPDHCNG